MKYRKLRIAWSVFCGLAAVLLIVLWVRSYWQMDYVRGPISATTMLYADSAVGRIGMSLASLSISEWEKTTQPISDELLALSQPYTRELGFGFAVVGVATYTCYLVPHYVYIGIALLASAAPWFRSRFSLRMLLIAATLVAVGLGLIVILAR